MAGPLQTSAIGTGPVRPEGADKVRGRARYAYEHPQVDPLFLFPLQATIARGRALNLDTSAAEAMDGVVHVLTPADAPPLADTTHGELAILRADRIGFRGQYLGAVLADTPEQARHAADLVDITYDADPHDAAFRADHPAARLPEDPDSAEYRLGDADTALAGADVVIDAVYTTPPGAQQPHGATHHRRPVGRRRAHPVAVDA